MFANLDDSHVTVVMYSKFSSSCTNFLEILAKVPTFKHTLLCIDNEDARKRVLTQSKLNVTEVPCIFRIYERTGYVETFEGERAFTILNTHYNHYLEKIEKEQLLRMAPPSPPPPPPPQQSPLPQQTQIPQYVQQTQLPQNVQQTQLQQQQTQLPQQAQQTQLLPQNYEFDIASQPPPTTMSSTPIDQLDQSYMSNPGPGPGQGPGPGMQIDRALKSGSGNIVSRAMQMQKERESGEPAKRPS
jgi:hypothetical protein